MSESYTSEEENSPSDDAGDTSFEAELKKRLEFVSIVCEFLELGNLSLELINFQLNATYSPDTLLFELEYEVL